jgi:hypothetical protein
LYSITANQAAIIALFRVINRYVGNLPPMSKCDAVVIYSSCTLSQGGQATTSSWRQSLHLCNSYREGITTLQPKFVDHHP